jgi:hypothetical protein
MCLAFSSKARDVYKDSTPVGKAIERQQDQKKNRKNAKNERERTVATEGVANTNTMGQVQ